MPVNGLPAANAAVNFDQAPFITKGKGPTGQNVEYYNFDVQPVNPAPIYVLFKEGSTLLYRVNSILLMFCLVRQGTMISGWLTK